MPVPGDVAIVGFGADSKSFSIVLLADLSGQTIFITDNGVTAAGGFRSGEGIITYVVPAGTAIGTVVTFTGLTGTVNPSTTGDSFSVYSGSAAAPTFLFAVDFADGNATYAGDATNTNTSAVPTGLVFGDTALAFGLDNGAYTGPTTGTRAEILAAIADETNWTIDDAAEPAVATSFTVTTGGGATGGSFAIVDASASEAAGAITFTVNRTGDTTGAVTLNYVAAAGTANAADFGGTLPSGTVNFAAGQTSQTITLAVTNDAAFEPDETFSVTLSGNTAGSIGRATATGTILNDDPAPANGALSIADASVNEGNSGNANISFVVTRDGGSDGAVSASYAVSLTGSADAADFPGALATGTVNFVAGQTTATIIVSVAGDTVFEGNDTFAVTLSAPQGGVTIADGSAIGTILNDDAAPANGALSIADASMFEGNAGTANLNFVVTRASGSAGAVSADYAIQLNGTAIAGDLASQPLTGTVNFAAGQTSATILVGVTGDTLAERSETFGVTLSNVTGGASIVDGVAVGTIRDDDSSSVFINEIHYDNSSTDANEGIEIAGPAGTDLTGFTLVLYNGNGGVPYNTRALSGVIGNQDDGYGTIAFTYPANGIQNGGTDAAPDTDGVALIGPDGQVVQFLSYEGVLTATTGPAAGLTSTNIGVSEDGTQGSTVSLQLTGSGSNPGDFTWQPDSTASFGSVNTNQDFLSATGPGQFRIGDASVGEGNSGTTDLVFTVTRAGGGASAAAVDYAIVLPGGATGADAGDVVGNQVLSGTVNFGVGVSSQQIVVHVTGDTVGENNENFEVRLSNAVGNATIADAVAVGTILNDDPVARAIYDIQGAGHSSQYVGQQVTTTGIVTGVVSNGFYLQDPTGDGNSATSDGIFVFTVTAPGVLVGDSLQVAGTVAEFVAAANSLSVTEITSPTITFGTHDNPLPAAVLIGVDGILPPTSVIDDDNFGTFDPNNDGIDFYESLEGMRVTIEAPVAVSNTNSFGETWTVASGGVGATGVNARGGITISAGDNNPERILIDSDSTLFPGYMPNHTLGDRLGDVTGIVNYAFQTYRVLVTDPVTVTSDTVVTRETTTLTGDADHLLIASFNVENLDTSDGAQKFSILGEEVVNALHAPDIIGLQEIQDADGAGSGANLSGTVTAQALIDAIVAKGGPTYSYIEIAPTTANSTGGEPNGNIRNGFLYNPARVTYQEGSVTLVPGAAYNGTRSPLAADFSFNGQVFTAVSVHSTSRGGSDAFYGPDQPPSQAGDDARTNQATTLRAYIDDHLATDPSHQYAVVGDFNGYYYENALSALAAGGVLTNLYSTLPVQERYSYLFDGNAQAFDNILLTSGLAQGAQFDVVHYNSEQPDSVYRATDHDQAVALLSIPRANAAPTANPDAITVAEDASTGNIAQTLLANDTDPNAGTVLTIQSVDTTGTQGTVVFDAATQSLRYVADNDAFDALEPGQTATDHFSYTVTDTGGLTSTAVATVTITGVSDVGTVQTGGTGDDMIAGTDQNDNINGYLGNDTITGGMGNDTLSGDVGDDRVQGGAGADRLTGGYGEDRLFGGDGADFLSGDFGNDTMTGGDGADSFSFSFSSGRDVITDFDTATDTILLQNGLLVARTAVADTNNDGVADLTIMFNLGSSMTLLGVQDFAAVHIERGVEPLGADNQF